MTELTELVFVEEEAVQIGFTGEAPLKAHRGDAAYDLRAASPFVTIEPGQTVRVPVELKTVIPTGYAGLICSRSGLAGKGIFVLNAPGIVDSGYRGEYGVILHNLSRFAHDVTYGDRIAQLLIVKLPLVQFVGLSELPDSTRGEGGFGSTGR